MIDCHDVTFRYPEAAADSLRSVSFGVRSGESLVVMGSNGSGKSTLGLLIAGLLKPTSGEIRRLYGADNGGFPPVGMLFQNPDNQMVSVQVDKEIAFALENQAVPMSRMEPMVNDTLSSFGIERLARRLTSELSGGEKQRVALASLMVYRPPILVLDEPDSYLDVAGRRMLRQELERLHREQPELIEIRITQYPGVARRYSRMLLLHSGRIVDDGSPDHVLRTSGLFGNSPTAAPVTAADTTGAADARAPEARLLVRDVSFAFERKHPVLDRVSFEIFPGHITGVVGPTGSGKSTLGLLLAGVLPPDSGTVELCRADGTTATGAARAGVVAAVLQQPERQFFLPTCAEEIAFGPANKGRVLNETEIDLHLNRVGLAPDRFRSRDPLTLSMGEKRRLAFAVILALGPAFIVFDEPTAGLDPDGVERFIAIARESARRGLGVVIITHELPVIRELVDRVMMLPGDGSVEELSAAAFLADPERRAAVSSAFEH